MMGQEAKTSGDATTIAGATENDGLLEALRSKLKATLEGPLTAGSLMKVQKLAGIGRELIITQAGVPSPDMGFNAGLGAVIGPMGGQLMSSGPQGAENFGANVIQEIMALASRYLDEKNRPSPMQLVEAISYAKKHEQTELADKLETELLKNVGAPKEG